MAQLQKRKVKRRMNLHNGPHKRMSRVFYGRFCHILKIQLLDSTKVDKGVVGSILEELALELLL